MFNTKCLQPAFCKESGYSGLSAHTLSLNVRPAERLFNTFADVRGRSGRTHPDSYGFLNMEDFGACQKCSGAPKLSTVSFHALHVNVVRGGAGWHCFQKPANKPNLAAPDMTNEKQLREKLRKIEALFAGAATPGERQAAGAAAERIRQHLHTAERAEPEIEIRYSIPDPWSRRMFVALCRRYGLKPFRDARMKHQTVVVRGPRASSERPRTFSKASSRGLIMRAG